MSTVTELNPRLPAMFEEAILGSPADAIRALTDRIKAILERS